MAATVTDPELPMLTLADLGVLRDVRVEDDGTVVVEITPTYTGCPAMGVMRADLVHALHGPGSPTSTSAPSSPPPGAPTGSARTAAASSPAGGIAPPGKAPVRTAGPVPLQLGPTRRTAACPLCGSADTEELSRVRRHRLQGAAPLPQLPRAVRARQGDLSDRPTDAPVSARRRPQFHPLTVAQVEQLTDDAVAVTFDVPAELVEDYRFKPGQALTLRRVDGDRDERRSYSICAPMGAQPRVGVREVPGGFFSSYLVHEVQPGDTIEVLPPSGTFTADLSVPGDHVFVVAGSGITPALSLAGTRAAGRDESTVTVFYGNRRTNTVMFADELADLKDRYGTRLQLVHVLSREPRDAELTSGRLDGDRLRALVEQPRRRRARRPLVAVRAARDGRRRPRAARPSSASRRRRCTRSCSTSTTSRRSRCAATRRPSPGRAAR